jgi:hypothetical protein
MRLRSDPRGGMDVLPAGNAPPPSRPTHRPIRTPHRRSGARFSPVGLSAAGLTGLNVCSIRRGTHAPTPPGGPLSLRRCIIRHRPEAPETPVIREGPDGGRNNNNNK